MESKDVKYNEPIGFKEKLQEIIFEADTPAGKLFDVILLVAILLSVVFVILESVESLASKYGSFFYTAEIILTILFTIEYLLRIWILKKPIKYMTSFFGVVDLLAVLPTYLSVLLPGATGLMVIRALRLLRVFRIFKLGRYLKESRVLIAAMKASRIKIFVFLTAVFIINIIVGSVMYLVEGSENGFNNIPESIYWAIVTMTTVGYGDMAPSTDLGRFFASIVMIMGYAIIAVPTGIVTAELSAAHQNATNTQACPACGQEDHAMDARFCKNCGEHL